MDNKENKKPTKKCGIIERGTVAEITDGKYSVASIDRDGIVTPPMLPLMDGSTFSVGDQVVYFYFDDGTGRIICAL